MDLQSPKKDMSNNHAMIYVEGVEDDSMDEDEEVNSMSVWQKNANNSNNSNNNLKITIGALG